MQNNFCRKFNITFSWFLKENVFFWISIILTDWLVMDFLNKHSKGCQFGEYAPTNVLTFCF